ncbi:hypothetical protein AVEN_148902-1 [Araneus ventricosus]|uniref:Reverse transcriptase domain-containing protein n=1 Tax=Araneus ventricosus TaxID=182803 RepID=A0A4Y2DJY3_ARAVE|nr:hypothetical protein AVEN_148902-1 [Araneus ventricosus]
MKKVKNQETHVLKAHFSAPNSRETAGKAYDAEAEPSERHLSTTLQRIQGAFDNLTHKSIEEKLIETICPGNIKTLFSNLHKDRKVIIPANDGLSSTPKLEDACKDL